MSRQPVAAAELARRAPAATLDSELTLREARARFFERNGMPPDGGYDARWIRVSNGRLPLYILNTAPRRRAVPLHDVHHVLTGYDTSASGEAAIGAWEVGAGTGPHWMAAVLDLAALSTGLFVAPRATFRAFVRGRRSRTLYAEALDDSLLAARVGELRARLGLDRPAPGATPGDALRFAGVAALSLLVFASFFAFAPLLLVVGLLLR